MSDAYFTTPFGRRPMTFGQLARQVAVRSAPAEGQVQKWQVFRDITEGKARLGVSDRSLAVLHALLSFHPETVLTSGSDLVVFPSNRELSLRAHGMAAATLRRHLAALIEAGLIIRRDSPNGKRYARKGPGGVIETAYGFDLSPLISRASEFERIAEEVRAHRHAIRLLRERITLLRRDIRKLIAFAEQEKLPGPWHDLAVRFADLSAPLPATTPSDVLEATATALQRLCQEVHKSLKENAFFQNLSANESQIERHQQTPPAENPDSESAQIAATAYASAPTSHQGNGNPGDIHLPDVLTACPTISSYSSTPISSWSDLLKTAELIRLFLGIGQHTWHESCQILGSRTASVVVAAILERHDQIRSPRAYLHSLTTRAKTGAFSVAPMIKALLRARLAATQPPNATLKVTDNTAGEAIGSLPSPRRAEHPAERLPMPPFPGQSRLRDLKDPPRRPEHRLFARSGHGP